MASALKNLSEYDDTNIPEAADMKFGIVVSEWNKEITHALYQGCIDTLLKHGAKEENIQQSQVPGSFELPAAARWMANAKDVDAVICLGCVIKGETSHNEYINNTVAAALMNLSLAMNKPFIFGVITPNTLQQAQDRAGGKHGNKGVEAAVTAIRMVHTKTELEKPKKKIGF
ncbi:MAG: 6,7-dimethyl-8-ribityllumazine synthase [Saprospiraceae bacterium]|nr:6,7-dimethyl-8-ribityllumazine synthase [Saprospiraceae bacterium]